VLGVACDGGDQATGVDVQMHAARGVGGCDVAAEQVGGCSTAGSSRARGPSVNSANGAPRLLNTENRG
jgi:hypothetical protein